MSARANRPVLFRTVLVIVGLLAGLALAEAVARGVYDAPWYDELLREQAASERFPYSRNSFGVRDREYADRPAGGTLRLLLVGDSFTFGAGVRRDEDVFPEIVERELNEEVLPGGARAVEALNAGLPSSLTGDWVRVWERLGERFRPDAVIAVFFIRDGTRTASISEFFGEIRDEIAERNRVSVPYRASYLYRLYRDARDRRLVAERYTRRFNESYFGDDTQTQEWQAARRNLVFLRDSISASGARFGLVIFPVLVELGDDYPFGAIHGEIRAFAEAQGIPVLDLLPAFRGAYAPSLWVSPLDQHPNERAHAIAAGPIVPFARDLLAAAPAESR